VFHHSLPFFIDAVNAKNKSYQNRHVVYINFKINHILKGLKQESPDLLEVISSCIIMLLWYHR